MWCKTCRHWTGTKYSQWADCSKVIATIQPRLLEIKKYVDDDIWYYWSVPFDPHETKYWNYSDVFIGLYRTATTMELPEGVGRETRIEQDIWMDQFGNERTKSVKMCYFMTHETFNCKYFDRRTDVTCKFSR